jgi:hemoglobin
MNHNVSGVRLAMAVAAFLLFNGCAGHVSAQPQQPGAGPTLYKRLGGYDAIAAVTDDFIARLAADKQLARFLVGLSADSQKKLRQHVVNQLCEATGGPCIYTGRTMKASHAGLGITESDWQATVKHLVGTLEKFKVPEKEKGELLAIASSLKPDIVEK